MFPFPTVHCPATILKMIYNWKTMHGEDLYIDAILMVFFHSSHIYMVEETSLNMCATKFCIIIMISIVLAHVTFALQYSDNI